MAKGKHATALFEVIQSAKLKQSTDQSGAFKTPKWWFKGRAASKTSPAASSPPADLATPAPAARPAPLPNDAPSSPTIIIFDQDSESCADPTAGATPARITYSSRAAQDLRSSVAAVDADADPDQQQIMVRFTYTSALIGAFAVIVIVALAYVIGSHMTRGPASAMGQSVEQLRSGKPSPGALKVNQGEKLVANDETPMQVAPPPRGTPADTGAGGTSGAQATTAGNGKRIVGMQYVLIQTYPEEADAKAAVELLAKNGIGATAEKGYWPTKPTWFTVIGTQEFDHMRNNPDFDKYMKTLNELSARFAGTVKFKRFEPQAVRWKDTR